MQYNPDLILNNDLLTGFAVSASFEPYEYGAEMLPIPEGSWALISMETTQESYPKPQYPIFQRPCLDRQLQHVKG